MYESRMLKQSINSEIYEFKMRHTFLFIGVHDFRFSNQTQLVGSAKTRLKSKVFFCSAFFALITPDKWQIGKFETKIVPTL